MRAVFSWPPLSSNAAPVRSQWRSGTNREPNEPFADSILIVGFIIPSVNYIFRYIFHFFFQILYGVLYKNRLGEFGNVVQSVPPEGPSPRGKVMGKVRRKKTRPEKLSGRVPIQCNLLMQQARSCLSARCQTPCRGS